MTDPSGPTEPSVDRTLDPPPPPPSDTIVAPAGGEAEAVVVTRPPTRSIRVLSILIIIAGVILIGAGTVTWFVVRDQLAAEKITVSDDADFAAGKPVEGPFTAYAQAEVINDHALEASGGLTYAQLDRDDPTRDTVMTASFLRASLFTSVVAFGVAFFAAGIGVLMILIGWALLRVERSLRA